MTARDLSLCQLRVRSDLPLPELPPWSGDEGEPDVLIRCLPRADCPESWVDVAADGSLRFAVAGVARFLVRQGREVEVTPCLPADAPEIALYVLGSVLGALCHQRGLLPLHASSVDIGGFAVAFCGPSGAGKSTLAAALLAQGHRMLSDDVTVLRPDGAGRLLAVPGFPRQKLWPDSLEALALRPGRALRLGPDLVKYERLLDSGFATTALPLAAICHLTPPPGAVLEPVKGMAALSLVRENIFRLQMGEAMGHTARVFADCCAVATAVPQYLLRRPAEFTEMGRFAAELPALLGL